MEVPLAKAKVSIVADMDGLEKGLKSAKNKITGIAVTTKKTTDRMNKSWDAAGKRIEKATDHLTSFKSKLLGIGAVYVSKQIASDFLSVAESFEAMGTQLDVLTNGRGVDTLDELNKWALDMPVNTEKVVDSFRLMTAMGLDPMISTISTLTDVASIFGDDVLQRLALQLGQASAKGKIMAQDLNIMAEAGINARQYIKDAFGMTIEEVQNSAIEVDKVIEAIFKGMGKEFGGAANKMMGTWRGLKTVTKSYFVEIERSVMAAGVFDELKTQLSDINDIMKDWLDANRDLIKEDVPKYIEKFKDAAEDLWEVINYDPAILKYGLLGLALGGKKGAVLFGGAAHILKTFQNTIKGAQAVVADEMSFLDFASSNFKELESKLNSIDHKKNRSPIIERLENERDAIKKTLEDFESDLDASKGGYIPDSAWDEFASLVKDLNAAEKKIIDAMAGKPKEGIVVDKKSVVDAIATANKKIKADKRVAESAAKTLVERQRAEKKYNDFVLDNMDQTTQEYQDLFLASEVEKWSKVKGITRDQLDDISITTLLSFKKTEEESASIFAGITENFTSAIQSELSGVFSDLLTGELDSVEDYFSRFTDSLTQMWGQMASKMVMNPSAFSAGNFAALGAAGVVIGGVSSILNSRKQKKEEEKVREQLALQIEAEVTGSIIQLELGDLDYALFQMDEKFKALTASAVKAKIPLDDIIKLRGLEVKALIEQSTLGYENLSGSITDFITGKQRESWTVSDWERQFGVLSDDLGGLDRTAQDYNDKSIELLTDQFSILKNIYQIQEAQLSSLDSTSESLVDQAISLQHSAGMPLDVPYFESQYDDLLAAALKIDPETEQLNTVDIATFQAFINDYMDQLSTNGADYNLLIDKASSDLLLINDAVQSEMELLTSALDFNKDAVKDNTTAIRNQILSLQDAIIDLSATEGFETWLAANPTNMMDSGPVFGEFENINELTDAMTSLFDLDNYGVVPGMNAFLQKGMGNFMINYSKDLLEWSKAATQSVKDTDMWQTFNTWAESFKAATTDGGGGWERWQDLIDMIGEMPGLPTLENVLDRDPLEFSNVGELMNLSGLGGDDEMNRGSNKTETKTLQPVQLILKGKVLSETIIDLSRTDYEFKAMLSKAVN